VARIRERLSFKALLGVAFWGASFVATSLALKTLTPLGLVATRMLLGSATLFALAVGMGRRVLPAAPDRLRCGVLGLILGGHLLIQAWGLQRTTATNTGWIIAFGPIAIAVGAWMFLRQKPGGRAWLGIALGAAGVLVIASSSGLRWGKAQFGDLLQIISCGTWAAYTLLAVGPVSRNGSLVVTVSAVAVAAGSATIAAFCSGWTAGPVTGVAVGGVAFLGIACSGLAFWLWNAAVKDVGSTTAGMYLYLEPFVTWLVAAVILGERVNEMGLVGGLLVLAGVWVVSAARTKPQ